jgi:hypothetical protein
MLFLLYGRLFCQAVFAIYFYIVKISIYFVEYKLNKKEFWAGLSSAVILLVPKLFLVEYYGVKLV